jgi:cytochrome bd ubiquinol oxidase subunit II
MGTKFGCSLLEGAMFAAFPEWYATMFSGYYLALVLMLAALIIRGIGIELRGKTNIAKERVWLDRMFFVGSTLAAFLWGVVAVNFVLGLPIGADKEYAGNILHLLDPRALLGGLSSLLLCWLHGSVFLAGQSKGKLREAALKQARRIWLPTVLVSALTAALCIFTGAALSTIGLIVGILGVLLLILAWRYVKMQKMFGAFICTGGGILSGTAAIFLSMFPNVFISNIHPDYSLTIYNASSSSYTLSIMAVVTVIFVPCVIGYQLWSYKTFLQKS